MSDWMGICLLGALVVILLILLLILRNTCGHHWWPWADLTWGNSAGPKWTTSGPTANGQMQGRFCAKCGLMQLRVKA